MDQREQFLHTYFYGVFLNIAFAKHQKHTIKVGVQKLLSLIHNVFLIVLGCETLKTEGFLGVLVCVQVVQGQTLTN